MTNNTANRRSERNEREVKQSRSKGRMEQRPCDVKRRHSKPRTGVKREVSSLVAAKIYYVLDGGMGGGEESPTPDGAEGRAYSSGNPVSDAETRFQEAAAVRTCRLLEAESHSPHTL